MIIAVHNFIIISVTERYVIKNNKLDYAICIGLDCNDKGMYNVILKFSILY